MKRMLIALLILALAAPALAEIDTAALESLPGTSVFLDGVNTVVRPDDQPFFGEADDGSVCAFLDFIELEDRNVVALRFSLSLESDEEAAADTLTLTVGKQSWSFGVHAAVSEYDMVYQEDYAVCLSDEGLALARALAKNKSGRVAFTLEGWRTVSGSVAIPASAASQIWSQYKKLGGDKQDLTSLRELWPLR